MAVRAALLGCICVTASGAPVAIQSLASSPTQSWHVRNTNGSLNIPATVPGVIHTDLLNAGVITEPYVDATVDDVRWVANETTWVYSLSFVVDPALSGGRVELVVEGIDAVASVILGSTALWTQDNAFRRTVFNVTSLLTYGGASNQLVIAISSPLRSSAQAAASCKGFCPPFAHDGNASAVFAGYNYIRKAQSDFGWDFAPNFAPSGIWRPIFLRGFNQVVLDDVTVVTTPLDRAAPIPISGTAEWTAVFGAFVTAAPSAAGAAVTVTVTVGAESGCAPAANTTSVQPGDNTVFVTLSCGAAQAWWPATLAGRRPTIYNATVVVATAAGETSSTVFEIGFRTFELRNPAAPDGNGELFFYAVNGRPLFLKGANWVLNDAFSSRADKTVNFLPKMESFVAAHYNALRVVSLIFWLSSSSQGRGVPKLVDADVITVPLSPVRVCAVGRRLSPQQRLLRDGQPLGAAYPSGIPLCVCRLPHQSC